MTKKRGDGGGFYLPAPILLLSLLLALTMAPMTREARAEENHKHLPQSLDPPRLEQKLDPFFATQLDELHVPGAVVVVVEGGEIVYARGYGYANLEQGDRYDPGNTIVHAGSTVKVITAMAVMQLAEQGKVDVHADVNRYLSSFQIPNTFLEPITLHHLLQHTAGLDHSFIGVRAYSAEELIPLAVFLADNLPPRRYPPGQLRHYNDYHIALAGLVVEEVSGMPFAEYVRTRIFAPLEMDSSFMLVPEEALDRLAVSYTYDDGRYRPVLQGNYYLHTAPGGTWNTTALDMANFIIVHLESGQCGESQVLQPETVAEMHRPQFTHDPSLPGMAYAFDERFVNGRRLLAKSGAVPGMQSELVLVPEEGVGWFVAYNRYGAPLSRRLNRLLMDSYFPEETAKVLDPPVAIDRTELQRYTGRYRELISYSSGSFEKISTLVNQVQVTADAEGYLKLLGDTWQPVGAARFQRDNGDYVIFEAGDERPATAFYYRRTPFLRIPWYEATPVQTSLVGLSAVASLMAIILSLTMGRNSSGGLRWLTVLTAGVNLAFIVGLGLFMMRALGAGEPPWELLYGAPPVLLLLLSLPLLSIMLTLALAGSAIFRWPSFGAARARAAPVAVILSTAALTSFAHTWNLLGYQF